VRRSTLFLLTTAIAFLPPLDAQAQRGKGNAAATGADAPTELNLAVGETRTLSARNVKNWSEGTPGLIDVKLTTDGATFLITGRRPGSTTLLFVYESGLQQTTTVNVSAQSPIVVERELNQLLEGMEGVHIRRVGAHIVIDGRVDNDSELQRVQQVASLYPGQVQTLVRVGGTAPPVGPHGQEQHYLVRIDFYFVQYEKDSNYQYGLGWPTSFVGSQIVQTSIQVDAMAGITRSATATLTNLPLPRLDFAASHGWAKVLKQATVVTDNGVNATFQNGGEELFSVTQGLVLGIQRVTFGAEVNVVPTFNPDTQNLDVKLTADVSDLTAPAAGTPLPGRITSKLNTEISLKLGQGLVLSGIRTQSSTATRTGIPGLMDIPILGALFSTNTTNNIQTEGAIFIVPNVITSPPVRTKEMVDTALGKFRGYEGNIDKINAYRKAPGDALDVPEDR
jgi:pilus assembly protein CpaC